jgi:hypothetical protein
LQSDIDAFATWGTTNRLTFNTANCKTITFSRKKLNICTSYVLFDAPLDRVNDIRDLGLTLDNKLDFHKHITILCKATSKLLGFIIRTSSELDSTTVVTVLYNAYVRSRLEYGAIIWDPHETKYSLMIERLQKKFALAVQKTLRMLSLFISIIVRLRYGRSSHT